MRQPLVSAADVIRSRRSNNHVALILWVSCLWIIFGVRCEFYVTAIVCRCGNIRISQTVRYHQRRSSFGTDTWSRVAITWFAHGAFVCATCERKSSFPPSVSFFDDLILWIRSYIIDPRYSKLARWRNLARLYIIFTIYCVFFGFPLILNYYFLCFWYYSICSKQRAYILFLINLE